jgi:hypothetical protein
MVVCLYLHHIAALLFGICLSLGCFEAFRRRVTGLTLGWLTINALVVIAWAWWLRFIYWLLAYGVAGLSWLSPPTLATATETLRAIYGEPYVNSGQPFVDAGCVLMGLVGLYAIRSRRIELLFMTAVTIGIPAAEIVVSLLKQPVFTVQTVEWVSPYFLVLIAAALTRLPWRSAVLAAIVLLAIRAIGLKNYFEVQKHEDWRAVATALDRHLCRGDLVLFGPFYLVEPIRYYLRDRLKDANQLGLQYDSGTILDPRLWPLATGTVSAEGTTIAAAPRVWVVSRQPGGIGPFDTELQPFLSSHAMVERVQAKSLLLRLYVDHTNSATCG